MNYAIILAAGKGSRMNVNEAKCATSILGKPMISYILDELNKTQISQIIPVLGHKKEKFESLLKGRKNVKTVIQEKQLGTGHAVMMAKTQITEFSGNTIIICGDMPQITSDVIEKMSAYHIRNNNDITLATTINNEPYGYGRVIKEGNRLSKIVEQSELTIEQESVNEINTGLYCVKTSILFDLLDNINNDNVKREYYLTDIIKVAIDRKLKVDALLFEDSNIFIGINDLYTLSIVENRIKDKILKKHMLNGVRIINPQTVLIEDAVILESGSLIYPNTIITNGAVIEAGCVLGPNTTISNSKIKKNVTITNSQITDCVIGANTTVGPFANLRQNVYIEDNVRIGNFVEIKKSNIKSKTKIAHLAYIGDANIGTNVNVGCGVITANYDGVNKHNTNIGDNVFIGSNTTIIAPIKVEDDVMIAAGSTISKNLCKGDFVVARSKEVIKSDYAYKYLKKNNK